MNIFECHIAAVKAGFQEYPDSFSGSENHPDEFIIFQETDLELRIYLTRMILCRCFLPGGAYLPRDYDWLINSFLTEFTEHPPKPWLGNAIREALLMVTDEKYVFTRGVIATTFLFGIIESWAKYLLGYHPMELDFFDQVGHKNFRCLAIGKAFEKLQQLDLPISTLLNNIDEYHIERLASFGRSEARFTKAKIADRLSLARNAMLHGESHTFYTIGSYLAVLYILFYYQHQSMINQAG